MSLNNVPKSESLSLREPAYVGPLLGEIGKQAASADATRSIDSALIDSIKRNDLKEIEPKSSQASQKDKKE